MRNRFTNPADGSSYDWPINHDNEEANEQRRNIERTAPTAGVGFVRQQGEDSPLVLRYSGVILTQAHHDEMQAWYTLSKSQSVHFRDFAGNVFEVLIVAFTPTRVRTVANPRGGTTNPHHFWRYQIEMEVLQIISGGTP
jgi:hypothetical protein